VAVEVQADDFAVITDANRREFRREFENHKRPKTGPQAAGKNLVDMLHKRAAGQVQHPPQ
jgi:hypothetical protein